MHVGGFKVIRVWVSLCIFKVHKIARMRNAENVIEIGQ